MPGRPGGASSGSVNRDGDAMGITKLAAIIRPPSAVRRCSAVGDFAALDMHLV
jgi:hypothetical protein